MIKNIFRTLLFFCAPIVSCTSNITANKDDLQHKSLDSLKKIVIIHEKIDTVCQNKYIVKNRQTCHLIFVLNDINYDSINFYIGTKLKSSININEYSSRLILNYDEKKITEKNYPNLMVVNIDSLESTFYKIEFLKRKAILEFKLKYHAPFVYINISKDLKCDLTYSFCSSEFEE